jgi:transcriptional regulator with XRE-family HTH domain
MRAARALLGIDQRELAELAGLSVPTIQRMEASAHVVRCNVDTLMRLLAALDGAGVALINEGAVSQDGGRGVRLKANVDIEPLGRKTSRSSEVVPGPKVRP